MGLTTDRNNPELGFGGDQEPTPQNKMYLILSDEERAKGFIRPVRQSYKHLVCGVITTMNIAIAETYARDPKFYDYTYCCGCSKHLPVSEFIWEPDGSVLGS